MTTTTAPAPATAKQIDLIDKLLTTRATQPHDAEIWAKVRDRASKANAHRFIDQLLAYPVKAPTAEATPERKNLTPGRYALTTGDTVTRYQIDRPENGKWAGWTFLSRVNGSHSERVRGTEAQRIIDAIAADPLAAATLYGKTTGRCGICSRELSNPESIERGIGPVCASRI